MRLIKSFRGGEKVSYPQIHTRFVFQSVFLRNRSASVKGFQNEISALFRNLSCFQTQLLENISKGMSATERNKL